MARPKGCPWRDDDNIRECGLPTGLEEFDLCAKHCRMQRELDKEDAELKRLEELEYEK